MALPDRLGSAPPEIKPVSRLALIAQTPATASDREGSHSISCPNSAYFSPIFLPISSSIDNRPGLQSCGSNEFG